MDNHYHLLTETPRGGLNQALEIFKWRLGEKPRVRLSNLCVQMNCCRDP